MSRGEQNTRSERPRGVSEAATTAKYPRRHVRKRPGPQSLPPPPGAPLVPDGVPLMDSEGGLRHGGTAKIPRATPVQMPLPAVPDNEPEPDTWFEQVPTNPASAPKLRDLAAYAGPNSFHQDSQDRAVTAPIDSPDDSEPGASSSWRASSAPSRPSLAALDLLDEAEIEDRDAAPHDSVTLTSRIAPPRPMSLVLAGVCLVIGMALGALLFGQRTNTTVIDCPDVSARSDTKSGG